MANKLKIIVMLASIPIFLYFWPSFLGGDTEFIIINGVSMLPTFASGSLAITKNTQAYEVGDIAAYKDESDRLVVHRIIEQEEDGFIFKGDNNKAEDPGIIKPETIHGEVIFVAPYLGYLSQYLKNPVIMSLTVLASIAVMFSRTEKKKKETYSFFSPAILINLLTYLVLQMSISTGITPKMDGYTNFLFEIFEPYVASTISFATWFFVIVGIHLMIKYYQAHSVQKFERIAQKGTLQIKEQSSVHLASQAFYLLLITIQMLYLMVAVKGLLPQN